MDFLLLILKHFLNRIKRILYTINWNNKVVMNEFTGSSNASILHLKNVNGNTPVTQYRMRIEVTSIKTLSNLLCSSNFFICSFPSTLSYVSNPVSCNWGLKNVTTYTISSFSTITPFPDYTNISIGWLIINLVTPWKCGNTFSTQYQSIQNSQAFSFQPL